MSTVRAFGKARLKDGMRRVRREVDPAAMIFIEPLDFGGGHMMVARRNRKSFLVKSTSAGDQRHFMYHDH